VSEARRPDHGVPSECTGAATVVEGYAQTLVEGRALAAGAVGRIGAGAWTGEAASAFCGTADALGAAAVPVVEAWDRVAAALREYGSELTNLQEEADGVRRRLTSEEEQLESLLIVLRDAQESSGAALRVATLTAQVAMVRAEVAACWTRLEDIASRRGDLDQRTAGALMAAPGPGGAAWVGIAYTPDGRRLPDAVVLDELLDRLTDGEVTDEDLDLLRQVLLSCSNDPAWCATMLFALEASGLVEVLDAAAVRLDDPDGAAAAVLLGLLTGALASASARWDAQRNQELGAALLDAIDSDTSHVLVPSLFTGAGLDPQVAVGALDHLEQMRVDDPDRFRSLADAQYPGVGAVGGYGVDLSAALFGAVSGSPSDALAFLCEGDMAATDRIRYWFGERDWTFDGFEGPATMLDAIVNATAAQQAREGDPFDPLWVLTTVVASEAFQQLGGNLHYTLDHVTPQASLDIAEALAPYAPEIAAGLEQGTEGTDDQSGTKAVVLFGQTVPALGVTPGNLSRLLGIATVEPRALAVFTGAVSDYAGRVVDWATADGHPPAEQVQDALKGVGALYGLTYASYGLESELHAELVSDAHRAGQDLAFMLLGAVPGVKTGNLILDTAIKRGALTSLEELDSLVADGTLTPAQLDAITLAARGAGTEALARAVTDQIADRWDGISPSYADPPGGLDAAASARIAYQDAEALTAAMSLTCDTYANAFSNKTSSGAYDVTLADGTTRARQEMG
jgi:uncharacterized protein YukE